MARAHRQFRHAVRGKDLAVVFVRRTDVDQHALLFLACNGQHVLQARAQGRVGVLDAHRARRVDLGAVGQRTSFRFPLLAAAVQDLHIVDTVDIKDPGAPGGEPVVVVAVKNGGGIGVDAGARQQGLELRRRRDVAVHGVHQVRMPAGIGRAGDMTAFVQAGIHADLNHPDLGIVEVLLKPFGGDQVFGVLRGRRKGGQGCRGGKRAGQQFARGHRILLRWAADEPLESRRYRLAPWRRTTLFLYSDYLFRWL
ncbi:hypothetical protein D3C86_1086420 [compost metagenome]